MKNFPMIDPAEKIVISLDFSKRLASGETVTDATLAITVTAGMDASASSRFGAPQIVTPKVLIPVSGCLDGVDYHLRVIAETSNPDNQPVFGRTLPCRLD